MLDLTSRHGRYYALPNAFITDEGIPTICETDIYGAITAVMMQAVTMGESVPLFADVTVRHPENVGGYVWIEVDDWAKL